MIDWLSDLTPVHQALVAGVFTWSVTAAGAALVIFTGTVSQRLLDSLLGFVGRR